MVKEVKNANGVQELVGEARSMSEASATIAKGAQESQLLAKCILAGLRHSLSDMRLG